MTNDARVSAWLASWQSLENASQLRDEATLAQRTGDITDKQQGLYTTVIADLIAKAAVYAQLANVSEAGVGLGAGEILASWQQQRERQEIANAPEVTDLADALAARDANPAKKTVAKKAPAKRTPRKRTARR